RKTDSGYRLGHGRRTPPGKRLAGAACDAGQYRDRLVERVPAGAGAARVGVVDRETLLLDRVHEVDRRAGEVRTAHLVGHDLNAVECPDDVAFDLTLVEVQLIAQARTTPRLDRDP